MPTPNYSIVFSAQLVGSSTVSVGDVLIPSAGSPSLYVVATAANRGTRRAEGVALSAYGGTGSGSVQIQQTGTIDASISGLGAGTASWVRVSTTGRLERVATPSGGDDLMGKCEADGRMHLDPGVWDSSNYAGGGGGGGAPTTATYVTLTTDAGLSNERTLAVSANGLTLVDGGAGAAVTLGLPTAGASGQVLTSNGSVWSSQAASGGGAPTGAQYLTLATDSGLTVERVFTPGTNMSAVDSGAGAAYTLNVPNLAGDVTGALATNVVARVNGATYPAAGALTVGTIPRVTGASAVAYGALDLANTNARTGTLPIGNGGTGLSTIGGNGTFLTVSAGAALWANSATFYGVLGGTLATTGGLRVDTNAQALVAGRNTLNTDNIHYLAIDAGNNLYVGTNTSFTAAQQAGSINMYCSTAGNVYLGYGGTTAMQVTSGKVGLWQPLSGASGGSVPFRFKSTQVTVTGPVTVLTAAQYECPLVDFIGTPGTASDVTFPDVADAVYWIDNRTANTMRCWKGSGAQVSVLTNTKVMIRHNGTDYVSIP